MLWCIIKRKVLGRGWGEERRCIPDWEVFGLEGLVFGEGGTLWGLLWGWVSHVYEGRRQGEVHSSWWLRLAEVTFQR